MNFQKILLVFIPFSVILFKCFFKDFLRNNTCFFVSYMPVHFLRKDLDSLCFFEILWLQSESGCLLKFSSLTDHVYFQPLEFI